MIILNVTAWTGLHSCISPSGSLWGSCDGVRWGGPHALTDTLAGLGGQRAALLRILRDVDSGDDWHALKVS